MTLHGIDFREGMHPDTERTLEKIFSKIEEEGGEIDVRDSISWQLLAGNLDWYYKTAGTEELIEISDRGNMSVSPYFTVNMKTQTQIQALIKELGLTTASRTRMNGNESKDEEPPIMKFLTRAKG